MDQHPEPLLDPKNVSPEPEIQQPFLHVDKSSALEMKDAPPHWQEEGNKERRKQGEERNKARMEEEEGKGKTEGNKDVKG